MTLVEITAPDFDVSIELAYATPANFTGKPVYGRAACYLHADAALCLRRAVDLAARQGLHFRIFDAFRPSEAQWLLWAHTPDPDFLADPRRGSPHSRGVAIDLTVLDSQGTPLDMGTGFDEFTPLSHHGNTAIANAAQKNRMLLLGLMVSAGWDFYRNEWWHYQLPDAGRYDVLSDEALDIGMM